MKFNFKKISALGSSLILAGMSVITPITAANYPAPFVTNGNLNPTSIVWGSGTGVSSLDNTQAINIQANLLSQVTSSGGSVVVGDGESHLFDRASGKLWLGNTTQNVQTSAIDSRDMPLLLKDGTYTDSQYDEFEYTQKIDVSSRTLELFTENEYKRDTPVVGLRVAKNAGVLNYTLEFIKSPNITKMVNTELEIMGKKYYILSTSASENKTTLLDSANTVILNEGETKTVAGKSVSISFIGNTVKLNVDGQITNSLGEGQTQRLADGSYIGVKEILVQDYAGGAKQVEFSIGSGRIVLENNKRVEMNGENVDGLTSTVEAASGDLQKIILHWTADKKLFVTEDSAPLMPGFETIKLVYTGMTEAANQEVFQVEPNGDDVIALGNFQLRDSTEGLNILFSNGTNYTQVGRYEDIDLVGTSGSGSLTFDSDDYEYFVLSYASGTVGESYMIRATNFKDNGAAVNTTTFERKDGGSWASLKANSKDGDVIDIGSASFSVGAIDPDESTVVVTAAGSNNLNTLYSKEGLKVWLPWINTTAIDIVSATTYANDGAACTAASIPSIVKGQLGYNNAITYNLTSTNASTTGTCKNLPATYTLHFQEKDKNGNIGAGEQFNVTVGLTGTTTIRTNVDSVGGINPSGGLEIERGKKYIGYVYGPLATKIIHDKNGDQYDVEVTYNSEEIYGKFYVASSGAVSEGDSTVNIMIVKDTELSSVRNNNVIVVGGSCINAAAAELLGVSMGTCGESFTSTTGIGSGQFLLQGFNNGFASGKLALLVAGYDVADTQNAATYLVNQPQGAIDTSKKYIGTSSINADMDVTAE